jgi:alpha-galactosidase
LSNIDNSINLAKYAGPGGWNDPDMLEVGNGALTDIQYRSHFALWCLMKAPLILGNNIKTMNQSALSIVTAIELIRVNQDPLGVPGDLIWQEGPRQVWATTLNDGSRAVVLFNRYVLERNVTILFYLVSI